LLMQGFPYLKTELVRHNPGGLAGVEDWPRFVPAELLPMLPGVPNASAAGLPGFEVAIWHGLYAPRGTPPAIIDRVNRELRRILSAGEAKSRLETLGNEVRSSSPDELRTHIAREVARWTQVIREAHIPQQ
jgi:tripartite-type tricarboxylate transporter receptor subunit TctC